jgi:flagellar basal body rod protein FlgG
MGAMVESSQHGLVSNNLANANTVGYKSNVGTFRELLCESLLQPGHRPEVNKLLEKTGGGTWLNSTATVFENGPVNYTGNPLNAAIVDKNGFFQVQKDGQTYLTRDGEFSLNGDGQLVMADGKTPVLSDAGGPIDLAAYGGMVEIRSDGSIVSQEDGALIANLGLYRVEGDEFSKLEKVGDNMFNVKDGANLAAGGVRVAGGAVEDSAVNPVTEMVKMIEATRAYQANMKFITIQDETLGKTVSSVGMVR